MKVKTKNLSPRNACSIIEDKKRKKEHSAEDIEYFIQEMMNNSIEDHQVTAWLMALYLNGMTPREIDALTDAMLKSGSRIKTLGKNVIDKHSTGGIGDKTSFILAPIAAAAGVKVPMIAGRGLGHTGGTVDKIEAINGFNTKLTLEEFEKQLENFGLVLMGQTDSIAPADKKIYALRDVTATVDHIGLITASIMSKKLAESTAGLVLDIKMGNGAFMQNLKDATLLARSLVRTAKRFKKKVVALITDMNQPLGRTIGHSNELIECFEILKGKCPGRLADLSFELAAYMIYLAGIKKDLTQAKDHVQNIIKEGKAIQFFKELIKIQNGDPSVVDDYKKLPMAKSFYSVKSKTSGYVKSIETKSIGLWLIEFGGGRKKKTDQIDYSVGFESLVEIGDYVQKGQEIFKMTIHEHQIPIAKKMEVDLLNKIYSFSKSKVKKPKLIVKIIKG